MTNDELKQALLSGNPVIYTGSDNSDVEYKCVSAIVYRRKNGRITVSAEITDKCGCSVVLCDPERLKVVR